MWSSASHSRVETLRCSVMSPDRQGVSAFSAGGCPVVLGGGVSKSFSWAVGVAGGKSPVGGVGL